MLRESSFSVSIDSSLKLFVSWTRVKMHAHKHLLTDLLKKELGFKV